MSFRYMIDTNICIKLSSAKTPPAVREAMRPRLEQASGLLCISSVTLAELHFGIAKADARRLASNLEALDNLTARAPVLPFDDGAAQAYGRVRHALQTLGAVIGALDMLIAGHALSRGLVVVTNNVGEFARVDGLQVEDWTEPANG